MEPMAYGALNLKPWEFGRLTPGEFVQLLNGYKWRMEQKQVLLAQFVAPIINTCTNRELKKPVTVEMLLGIERKADKKSNDQAKEELKKLLAEVG